MSHPAPHMLGVAASLEGAFRFELDAAIRVERESAKAEMDRRETALRADMHRLIAALRAELRSEFQHDIADIINRISTLEEGTRENHDRCLKDLGQRVVALEHALSPR